MMSDEDELYTKVVVHDEIYNFVVQYFLIWDHLDVQIYTTRFYRVNTKGVHMLQSHECGVVVKDLEWRSAKTKVVDVKKLGNFIVHNFFI